MNSQSQQAAYDSLGVRATMAVTVLLLLGLLAYFLFLNHVDVNEIAIAYDSRTGNVWVQDTPGWYRTDPFTKVICISTAPALVTLPANGAKVITQYVIQFNPAGAKDYAKLQGYSYIYGSNVDGILMGYLMSGKDYPFLTVLDRPQSGFGSK